MTNNLFYLIAFQPIYLQKSYQKNSTFTTKKKQYITYFMHKATTFQDERPDFEARLAKIKAQRHPIAFLLDGITDLRNIGLLFRLADAALIEKIYIYNSPDFELNKKVKRISRSTTNYVPHQILQSLEELENLQKQYEIVALEITNKSIPYTDFKPKNKTLLVIGNEQKGVSQDLLNLAKKSIHIPMFGINTSMNVSCATSIATYGLLANYSS